MQLRPLALAATQTSGKDDSKKKAVTPSGAASMAKRSAIRLHLLENELRNGLWLHRRQSAQAGTTTQLKIGNASAGSPVAKVPLFSLRKGKSSRHSNHLNHHHLRYWVKLFGILAYL